MEKVEWSLTERWILAQLFLRSFGKVRLNFWQQLFFFSKTCKILVKSSTTLSTNSGSTISQKNIFLTSCM